MPIPTDARTALCATLVEHIGWTPRTAMTVEDAGHGPPVSCGRSVVRELSQLFPHHEAIGGELGRTAASQKSCWSRRARGGLSANVLRPAARRSDERLLDLETDLKDVLLRGARRAVQQRLAAGRHHHGQPLPVGEARRHAHHRASAPTASASSTASTSAGKKVLDLGSNLGELSRAARERGARSWTASSTTRTSSAIANLINALNGVTRVSFSQRDIADLETYDQRYDIVLAFAVFAYISGAIPRIAQIADVLVFETHKLDGDFEEHYVRPISKYFPAHRVIAASDWGMETDQQAIRAVIVFAKDEEILQCGTEAGSWAGDGGGRRAAVPAKPDLVSRHAAARRPAHLAPGDVLRDVQVRHAGGAGRGGRTRCRSTSRRSRAATTRASSSTRAGSTGSST